MTSPTVTSLPSIPVYYFHDEIGTIRITNEMTYSELLDVATQFLITTEPQLLSNPNVGVSIFAQYNGVPLETINRVILEWSLVESMKKDLASFGKWMVSLGSTLLADSPLDGRVINDTIITGPSITNNIDRIQILSTTRPPPQVESIENINQMFP